jgi:hypothetical protein
MRATLAVALALVAFSAGEPQLPAPPVLDYATLVDKYKTRNADEAVAQAVAFERLGLVDSFTAFLSTTPSAGALTAAAAMHTEAGLRLSLDVAGPFANRQLDLAAAIIEIGTAPRTRRLGAPDLRRSTLPPVSAEFRRLWYLTVVSFMENGGRMSLVAAYLDNARALFPRDPEFLLLSGIAEEMLASNLLETRSDGERRKSLGRAEAHLRASLALAPDRTETKLRLGRVLSQLDQAAEARPLLTTVSDVTDERLSYLASLFLGGLEDSAGNTAAAARWYAQAAARMPAAQAASLAGSELQHRAGKRQDAAVSAASGAGADKVDPWWSYPLGEYWRIEVHLNALRRSARP